MSEKQTNLFGGEAGPKSVLDSDGEGEIAGNYAPMIAEKIEPMPCPNCHVIMTPQKDAPYLQVCPQCSVGYNVNYDPPQIYYESRKDAPVHKTESVGSQDIAEQSGLADHVHIPTICPKCKEDKELYWVNPGGLGPNQELCKKCIPKLFEGYGYKEPGYRIIDDQTVEIFSETTGWEKIKTHWVKEFFGNSFANDLFPVAVHLEHEEIKAVSSCKLDHETFGITWAAARFLSARSNVPMPKESG